MKTPLRNYLFRFLLLLGGLLLLVLQGIGQERDTAVQANPVFGPKDTLSTPGILYNGEFMPYRMMQDAYVFGKMSEAQKAAYEAWTRLRNAVYVTYPYARRASLVLNDINNHLINITDPGKRKTYIKSREKELKKEFAQPLMELSVYQGKVLMKLINRETGNNCYEIVKEYKGGFSANFWQTVAWVFGSSLKQPYDAYGEDLAMEKIVLEVKRMYGI